MKILHRELEDIKDIFKIYNATYYQKTVNYKSWRGFERTLIEKEIGENRHFKIVRYGELACTFVIAFNNPIIWQD
ncbi:MAG TPA: hypothetical protein VKY41_07070 [Xanthomarina sp.]|nr:hypothetical protein [Xanthomarina sp.]